MTNIFVKNPQIVFLLIFRICFIAFQLVQNNLRINQIYKMKYFAIGDIHGNYKALKQCLERSDFNYEEDTLIAVGDYVDRYPEPHLVVEELLKIKNFIGLLGNHDIWFIDWLFSGKAVSEWLTQGGQATFDAYTTNPEMLQSEAHRSFFKNLKDYYILELEGLKYGFVHAGWLSSKGLGYEKEKEIYYWNRKLWERATKTGYEDWIAEIWGDLDYAFIGHTNTHMRFRNKPPISGYNGKLINLDQGAGWSGYLTICNIQTFECWQSDKSKLLYPGLGRFNPVYS